MALLNNSKYFDIKDIIKMYPDSSWYLILGERSSGKTYSTLKLLVEEAYKLGRDFAIIRRWQEDFRGRRGATLFDSLQHNKEIEKATNGDWNGIYYYSMRFYFCKYNDEGTIEKKSDKPCGYCYSLNSAEHDKGSNPSSVFNIVFDEMIATGGQYLVNEFVLLMNVISTILRDRNGRIVCLGNTVSLYNPYFGEFRIKNPEKIKMGQTVLYEYDNGLKLVLHYTNPADRKDKESTKLFSFGNQKLSMIIGDIENSENGSYQFDLYPHLPKRYKPKDIIFKGYIEFSALNKLYYVDIVVNDEDFFAYINNKHEALQERDSDIIFTDKLDTRFNHIYGFNSSLKVVKILNQLFRENKVYYYDNSVGDAIASFRKMVK